MTVGATAPSASRRKGSDVAIVTWGTMVPKAMAAAEALSADGIEAYVLDLRWLNPIDDNALKAAVLAVSGKVVIAHEATRSGGFAGEIALRIIEQCSDTVKPQLIRVTTPDVRMPASAVLQKELIPQTSDLVRAAKSLL